MSSSGSLSRQAAALSRNLASLSFKESPARRFFDRINLMQETNWVVITGGPSSGKSTVLEYLKTKGYLITVEMARVFIDEEIAKGKTLAEIRADGKGFQDRVLQMKIELEEQITPDQITFFDRGIPDSIAYVKISGGDITQPLQASQKRRYRAVFLFDQVPFEQDYARTEDEKESNKISQLLYEAYTDPGYNVFRVPLMSVGDRAEFILKELNRF